MWIKVEDTKRPISGVALTWSINTTPGATYGEVTIVSSGSTFSGYTTSSVIQVSEFDKLTDELNNTCEESVYLKVKTATSATQIVCEIYWPKTTSVKRFNRYGEARKTTKNTADEYKDIMIDLLQTLVTGEVLDSDYKVYQLVKGINHKWHLYDSSQILSIVNGKKQPTEPANLNEHDMYFSTCCSYAYVEQRDGVPPLFNTGGTIQGLLGPFFNIADDISTLLMGCNSCGGGYYMDTSAVAKEVETTTAPSTGTGNQSNNMYGLDSEEGYDRSNKKPDRKYPTKTNYNKDGSRKKPPIKDSDFGDKFYK